MIGPGSDKKHLKHRRSDAQRCFKNIDVCKWICLSISAHLCYFGDVAIVDEESIAGVRVNNLMRASVCKFINLFIFLLVSIILVMMRKVLLECGSTLFLRASVCKFFFLYFHWFLSSWWWWGKYCWSAGQRSFSLGRQSRTPIVNPTIVCNRTPEEYSQHLRRMCCIVNACNHC